MSLLKLFNLIMNVKTPVIYYLTIELLIYIILLMYLYHWTLDAMGSHVIAIIKNFLLWSHNNYTCFSVIFGLLYNIIN